MPKDKLKPGFDPLWNSEFLDFKLKKMSKTAYILRQMYRSYRNPETNLCSLSEYQIKQITGFDREAIRRAKRQLITFGEITPKGSFLFLIKPFHQFKDQKIGGNTAYSETIKQAEKPPTIGGNTAYPQADKPPTVGGKDRLFCAPSDTDITDIDSTSKGLVCKDCQNYDPEHLDNHGNKTGYCPILLCVMPPFMNASSCQNFFARPSEIDQPKPETCQEKT